MRAHYEAHLAKAIADHQFAGTANCAKHCCGQDDFAG
jgi:hypothetical protein